MNSRNQGVIAEPLFVAVTRPAMRWGVTYAALLVNMVFTLEAFLLSKNLLTLLIAVPIHGICALLCARDARCFDLLHQWARTRMVSFLGTYRYWQASSHSPLKLDLPGTQGNRRAAVNVYVSHMKRDAV